MAYIAVHYSIWTDRKTLQMAERLGLDETTTAAHVLRLQTWALGNVRPSGEITGLSDGVIAAAAGWKGDAKAFSVAFSLSGWITHVSGRAYLYGWDGPPPAATPEPARARRAPPERPEMRRQWESMAAVVRPVILERDGYQCVYCGETERLEIDHVLAIARGGDNDPSNLQTLCLPCNRSKGAD